MLAFDSSTAMLRQVIIQLDTNGHSYKGVPSNPSTLPRNGSQQLQLHVASPLDACQPLLKPLAGEVQCTHTREIQAQRFKQVAVMFAPCCKIGPGNALACLVYN